MRGWRAESLASFAESLDGEAAWAPLTLGRQQGHFLYMVTIDKERLTELCKKHGVAVLKIFGSAARGDEGPDSDIDLLIEFRDRKGLLALVGLEIELSEALGRKVDLVTEASLSPYIRDRILSSASVIYEGEG